MFLSFDHHQAGYTICFRKLLNYTTDPLFFLTCFILPAMHYFVILHFFILVNIPLILHDKILPLSNLVKTYNIHIFMYEY
jgi:hypothetical protein